MPNVEPGSKPRHQVTDCLPSALCVFWDTMPRLRPSLCPWGLGGCPVQSHPSRVTTAVSARAAVGSGSRGTLLAGRGPAAPTAAPLSAPSALAPVGPRGGHGGRAGARGLRPELAHCASRQEIGVQPRAQTEGNSVHAYEGRPPSSRLSRTAPPGSPEETILDAHLKVPTTRPWVKFGTCSSLPLTEIMEAS